MRITIDEIRAVAFLHRTMHAHATQRDVDAIVRQEKDAYYFARQELVDYLNGLEYEKVLELETLMEFGREWHHHAEFEYDDNDEETAAEFSVDIMSCFDNFRHFVGKPEGKREAISYLIGKAPLSQYLHAALQHCNPDTITLPV